MRKSRDLSVSHFLTRCPIALCLRPLNRHCMKISISSAPPLSHSLPVSLSILSLSTVPLRIIAKLYIRSDVWLVVGGIRVQLRRETLEFQEKRKKYVKKKDMEQNVVYNCDNVPLVTTTILFFSTSLARILPLSFCLPFSLSFSLSLSRLLYYEINPRIRLSRICCNSLPLSPMSIKIFRYSFSPIVKYTVRKWQERKDSWR